MCYNEAALSALWLSPEFAVPMYYEVEESHLAKQFAECLRLLEEGHAFEEALRSERLKLGAA